MREIAKAQRARLAACVRADAFSGQTHEVQKELGYGIVAIRGMSFGEHRLRTVWTAKPERSTSEAARQHVRRIVGEGDDLQARRVVPVHLRDILGRVSTAEHEVDALQDICLASI